VTRRQRRKRARDARELLPVEALDQDGLLVRSDGALVRYLEVIPSNPLALDEAGCERMTRGLTDLLLRVPASTSVQLYAEATHIALDGLLRELRADTNAVLAPMQHDAMLHARSDALRQMAALHEESLTQHAHAQAALDVRFTLVVPYIPAAPSPGVRRGGGRRCVSAPLSRALDEHLRLARASLELSESLRSALSAADMQARLMSGPEVADLLWRRLSPQVARTTPRQAPSRTPRVVGDGDHAVTRQQARLVAARLRDVVCQGAVDLSDPRRVIVDGDLEHTIYLARRPERTFYGWLLHAMQSTKPWTLSMHVHVLDRAEMRARYAGRERRLAGLNEGRAEDGRRPDRDQIRQEQEYAALIDADLASGAETLCDVALYQTIREPGPEPDPRTLHTDVVAAMRALGGVTDAHVSRGELQQTVLWRSTLPLGLDVARRRVRLVTRNVADSSPFVSTSSGSPAGLPFAFAEPGRTVERLDPFDRLHDNGVMLVFAKSGGGKTATVLSLLTAAIPRGVQANVIDRSTGHYRFACDLLPGAVHVEPGDDHPDSPVINPWDVDDPATVPRRKVAFLVRLHALLIGDQDTATDGYGLNALERSLLAVAIREVYARAARQHTAPRERDLRDTLLDLAAREAGQPSGGEENAATYRTLAQRLSELCEDGTYGYLLDRPTSVAADDAPLLVINTRKVPDDEHVSTAAVFIALEHIITRVERRYEQHLRNGHHGSRGSFAGTSVVVLEETWKLMRRRATREWVIEQAKRARHIGLWLIAVTQQRSDLTGEESRALLANSSIQLFLRLGADELEHVSDALSLSHEEREQIRQLTTEKGAYAQAYLINGERGRGTVSIRLGDRLYWACTSDPTEDLPLREQALQHAGFYTANNDEQRALAAHRALRLLAGQQPET
jgi:hypothetical protein